MSQQIQLRNGTAAAWTSANPTLAAGEAGVETDTNKVKFGNGVTAWTSLAYLVGSGGGGSGDALVANPLSQFAATTSAQLRGVISDETGTGVLVFATSPTLVTPNLGTPSALTLTNATGLPISTGVSGLGTGVASWLASPSSANLAAAITDETGSGSLVFGTSPTIATPTLTGIVTHSGADLVAGTAVSANAINFGVGRNNQTLTSAVTVTFTGSPATDQFTQWYLTGDTVARVVTLPANVRSVGQQTVVASFSVPANWSGPIFLLKTAAGYDMAGEPIALANKGLAGRFGTGANDTQVITLSVPFAGTITNFLTQSASGTATYQLVINATNVTGGSNSVSSTLVNNTPSANNVVAAGDKLSIVRTSDSSCVNADFSIIIAPTKA